MKRAILAAGLLVPAVLAGRVLMSSPQDEVVSRLSRLLPESVQGWKTETIDDLYDPQTIFQYIDGAGEVYIAYNFKHLLSRRYKKGGQPDIIADLFDMGTPADAFGVFTHDLDGDDPGVGQGGTYKAGLLSFWRDRFFVSLFAERETPEAKAAMAEIGKTTAAWIGRDGSRPLLLRLLPPEFAADKAVHYFHSPVVLNYHFFVGRDNLLKLGPDTEAVLSKPARGKGAVLLIVKYGAGAGAAAEAYRSFVERFSPRPRQDGLAEADDGTWIAAASRDDIVLVVFRAPTAERAREILAEVPR
jgi:hypothetical protein